jgi:hypothetical protein
VDPRGRSEHGRSCSGAFGGDKMSAQGWSLELDAMSAVHDAVQRRVGQGGVSNDLVPAADRDLAGDQQRASIVAVVDDLEEVATLLGN